MARPKPIILSENIDQKTFKTTQILESAGIWVVVYNNKSINIRDLNIKDENPNLFKYRKTAFSNKGSALNLCKKLNSQFNTKDFSVIFVKVEQ